MNPRLAFVVVLSATAAGCTPLQWSRAEAQPEQVQADADECRHLAWVESSRWVGYYGRYGGFSRYRSGFWPPGPVFGGPLSDPFFEEGRLARYCMESKGYSLQPLR